MAPHSSTLAWKIPGTEEPGGVAVHGIAKSQTRLSDFIFTFHFHALEREMATHSSVLAWRNPRYRGAWWATIYGVAQSRTRLKQLSSSSSILYFQLNRNSKPESFKFQTLSSDSLNGGRDFQCCLHESSDMGTLEDCWS